MYLVELPEGKKDVDDLTLAYSLGHETDQSRTEVLKHEGYTLALKGTLIITLSNGDTLSGPDAFDRVGHDVLNEGLESLDPSQGYRVIESPWLDWEDEQGYSINAVNVISRNPEIEKIKLENLLDELFS